MLEPIPFLDLPRQHQAMSASLMQMFADHVLRAAFIGGEAVTQFETAFARFCKTQAASVSPMAPTR